MAEWIDLRSLLEQARPGRLVAAHGAAQLDQPEWLARARGWREAFAAAAGRDWALHFDEAPEFAAALFGAWHAGKRVYLAGDTLPATLEALRGRVDGFAGDLPADCAPLAPLAVPARPGPGLAPLDERACELVVFTSGSTGQPEAIGKRLDQLAREVEALQAQFGAQLEGACVHGTVSHQHIYGLLFRVLWPLAAGRPMQPRLFFHEDLAAALADADAVLVASPAHLRRLPGQLDWARVRGRVRAVFSSGGPLPGEAAGQARELLGIAPVEVFGSSETGGIAWRRWDGDAPGAWQALPGVELRIEDGCLAVSSPHLEQPGWWRTRDRVEALADGRFRLLGRADRIVKIEERRVSLDALERELRDHPLVEDVRVFVLPGAREQLAAVVATADAGALAGGEAGRRTASRALSAHLQGSHDAVVRPRRWRFVPALPANAQGKTTQAALADLFRPVMPQAGWLRREADKAVLELALDPALQPFDGHFPQAAILPGVAQLDWAIALARQAFAMPPRFLRMEALKFQHVARPGDVLRLELDWAPAKAALAFRYTSAHGVHSSGRVVFADVD